MTENINNSDSNTILTLNLTLKEVNYILTAMQDAPFKIADPLLKNIVQQSQEQLNRGK